MPLRNGQEYLKQECLSPKNQPFKLILLSEKIPRKYQINIDFDEASRQWRKNKVSIGEGGFRYKRFSERLFNHR